MGIIKQPLRFEGSKGESNLYSLFDSGATLSCIRPDLAGALGVSEPLRTNYVVETANGEKISIGATIRLDFYLNDTRLSDEFLIVPDLSEEAIIGAATMQKWRIKLDFEHDVAIVNPQVSKLILKDLKI
jgi:predicted aspartyl protease